ncbi:VacJ family lipoprotein [Halomonas sp. 18H]|uniref:MlaA family lipoprotein n=1 Tax=Halomonas almeriensis TaxID=308163 RepID=UPI002231B03D|nr:MULTISPECIES: VacJ family lipoprotein [Halomonas]MCW4151033.1 VacJ family lipoprotein [Halomonas sp. 18H]MDN3552913.1 VacJ family lipoprotein [Halomonas almeriensis]
MNRPFTTFFSRGLCPLAAGLALALLSGCAATQSQTSANPDDPWEGFNRGVFAFNETVDRYALKPLSQGYRFVTPDPVEAGVGNFFSNLGEIRTTLNSLLQGKGSNASASTGRFVLNSTVGLLGLFDVATPMGLSVRDEDFGQTLATWGVGEGPYLVLPLLGPSTVRDTGGLPVDMYTYPVTYVEHDPTRLSLSALRTIDTRAGLLEQEKLIQGDRYTFIRDSWLQRRRFEVSDGELGEDPFASDDFDLEGSDFDDAFAE